VKEAGRRIDDVTGDDVLSHRRGRIKCDDRLACRHRNADRKIDAVENRERGSPRTGA
jgi:hypothetical protein